MKVIFGAQRTFEGLTYEVGRIYEVEQTLGERLQERFPRVMKEVLRVMYEVGDEVGEEGDCFAPLAMTLEEREEVPATRAARDLAEAAGIDMWQVTGTGKGGQVTVGDVRRAIEEASPLRAAVGLVTSKATEGDEE